MSYLYKLLISCSFIDFQTQLISCFIIDFQTVKSEKKINTLSPVLLISDRKAPRKRLTGMTTSSGLKEKSVFNFAHF